MAFVGAISGLRPPLTRFHESDSSSLLSGKPSLLYSSQRIPGWKRTSTWLPIDYHDEEAAHFAEDAPFAVAIGASILVSLAFPVRNDPDEGTEDDDFGGIDFTDTRFGVMGILSVIPYFNWMSWIFAWLDTGRQRYLVYSIMYLAPYITTNLSISPDDSWLPIFSILANINGIPLLDKAVKYLFPAKKKDIWTCRERSVDEIGGSSETSKQLKAFGQ
ncbi:unnamed protein product [Spirodela intermedia]|uniref:Uncharacterized protein n=1 Tax=Spirodela intermedia TaxID=51605 RepID=A0A7I8LM18_SPIIN|nr:unnamed protein product [Spirodela intermedia]